MKVAEKAYHSIKHVASINFPIKFSGKNQHCSWYDFIDGSRFVFYNRALGLIGNKNYWCTVAYFVDGKQIAIKGVYHIIKDYWDIREQVKSDINRDNPIMDEPEYH